MPRELLYAVLSVPILLIISLTVFNNFFNSSRSNFEVAVTGEVLGTGPGTFTTAFPAKPGSATIYNGNALCGSACTIDYKDGLDKAVVTAGSSATGQIKIDYTAYAKEGYSELVKTYRGTHSGYNLAGLLQFILIAMVILGAIITAVLLR
jgi:hypothetical protein